MNLILYVKVDRWFCGPWATNQRSDIILKLADRVEIEKLGPLSDWIFSVTVGLDDPSRWTPGYTAYSQGLPVWGSSGGTLSSGVITTILLRGGEDSWFGSSRYLYDEDIALLPRRGL